MKAPTEQAEMQTRFVAGMDHIWEGQRPLIWFDYINRMGPLPGEMMDRQARDWFTFQAKIKHRIYTLLDERAETSQLRMFEVSDVGFSIQDYVDRWNPNDYELKSLKSYWRLIDGAWHSCAMANLMWKRSGKNVVVIESQLQKNVRAHIAQHFAFRHSIGRGRICLHFPAWIRWAGLRQRIRIPPIAGNLGLQKQEPFGDWSLGKTEIGIS